VTKAFELAAAGLWIEAAETEEVEVTDEFVTTEPAPCSTFTGARFAELGATLSFTTFCPTAGDCAVSI
jgi:hypothetical protein